MMKLGKRWALLKFLGNNIFSPDFGCKINPCSAKICSSKVGFDNVAPNEFTSPKVVSIIETVQQFGIEEFEVKTLLDSQPELLKKPKNSWQNIVETFINGEFDKNDILTILQQKPNILNFNKDQLNDKLMAWVRHGLGNDLVCQVLTTHPHLLDVDSHHVLTRIKQFQLQFESKRRVGKLFLLAPNTLEERWEIICDKLNYLNDLCTDNSDIVASGVLAHDLFHIKARHEFLIRAGIYKMPQKDFNKRLSKNPKLEKIVNTTDDEFLSNVAGLSHFEYSTFLEMYQEELRDSLEHEEIDSDDDVTINKLNYTKRNFYKK